VIDLAELGRFFETLTMDRVPVVVEEMARDWVWARLPTADVKLRPGGYVPGPTLMSAVDLVAWVLVFTRAGITPMALTWDLKINFLRPAHGADVILDARQTKFGRLCHASIDLFLDGDPDRLVAHATTTYALP
jgi:uncharacterized protein (TIGR00369 family)